MSAPVDLTSASIAALSALLRERRVSSLEIVDAHLARIERENPKLNAVVRLDPERARARAREADAALARGEARGALHGIPFTLKDMHAAAGFRASVGTRATEVEPARDGVVAERLVRAGGVLLGKTNMSNSLQTLSEQFGRTSNPYDARRTSGGSSGGAAAAVAARLSVFDVGTDLSGSIRMPAHFCGVFGLRPTPHRIPVADLIVGEPGTPRLERLLGVAGPMARSASDVATLFRVLAGPDPRDPEVPPVPVADAPKTSVRGLRVALASKMNGIRVASEVSRALEKLGDELTAAGARVEVKEPLAFDELLAAFRGHLRGIIGVAVAAGLPVPGAPGPELRDPPPAEALQVLAARDRLITQLDAFFGGFDIFVCPAATTLAFTHRDAGSPIDVDGVSCSSMTVDHPTIVSTFTGAPSLVVPIGLSAAGLPIGAQLVGPRWQDERLISMGEAISEIAGTLPAPSTT